LTKFGNYLKQHEALDCIFLLFCIILLFLVLSKLGAQETPVPQFDTNTQLAVSVPDYQVTAGDVYSITYGAGTQPISFITTLDNSYRLLISNIGSVNARGKTYTQLKSQVESLIRNSYPMSGAQMSLVRPAQFRVTVTGEITQSQEITTWALRRLSSVVSQVGSGSRFSTRSIEVASENGKSKTYDLFLATRNGDFSQDPYLRPNDVIKLQKVQRSVTLRGAVRMPGTYQLLDGENLKDLINAYGGGFTPQADKEQLSLQRYTDAAGSSVNLIYLPESAVQDNFALIDFDTVYVPLILDRVPLDVITFEGTVQ
jgi:protein involved in polysaccharide export with SLBB domain